MRDENERWKKKLLIIGGLCVAMRMGFHFLPYLDELWREQRRLQDIMASATSGLANISKKSYFYSKPKMKLIRIIASIRLVRPTGVHILKWVDNCIKKAKRGKCTTSCG